MSDAYDNPPRLPDVEPIDPGQLVSVPGQPVELEIGSGRGGFAVERLSIDPGGHLIGLEIKRKWACIVDGRLKKSGLGDRGRVFFADARTALPRFRSASLSTVFIHFPDPWWKKRHQKRMLIGEPMLHELRRLIVVGGELFVQTDVEERALHYQNLVDRFPGFEPFTEFARVDDHPYVARSPRERRVMQDGLPIFRLRYRRDGHVADGVAAAPT